MTMIAGIITRKLAESVLLPAKASVEKPRKSRACTTCRVVEDGQVSWQFFQAQIYSEP